MQRPDFEYEFDIVLDMSVSHVGEVTKSRFEAVADKVVEKPGEDFARLVCETGGCGSERLAGQSARPSWRGAKVYGDGWMHGDARGKLAEWKAATSRTWSSALSPSRSRRSSG